MLSNFCYLLSHYSSHALKLLAALSLSERLVKFKPSFSIDMEHLKQPFELYNLRLSPGEEIGEEVVETKGGNAADKRDMLRMGKNQKLRVRRQ